MTSTPYQVKFAQAPSIIRDLLVSEDYQLLLNELMGTYKFSEDDRQVLSDEIEDFLLGSTRPENFVNYLRKFLDIPLEQAANLAKELNERLFSEFKEELREVHHQTTPGQTTSSSTIQAIAPGLSARMASKLPPQGEGVRQAPSPLEQKLGNSFSVPPTTPQATDPRIQTPRTLDPYRESTDNS